MDEKEFKKLAKQQIKEQREWEDSHDGILERAYIQCMCRLTSRQIRDDGNTVIEVLHDLPRNIRETILPNTNFIVANGSHVLPTQPGKLTIVLRFERKETLESRKTTIAHEIAHVYRYIKAFEKDENHIMNGGRKEEIAADDLCEKWGFGRSYKSYDDLPK